MKQHTWFVVLTAALAADYAITVARAQGPQPKQEDSAPVFIYYDGWFVRRGYDHWDIASTWRRIPEAVKPHAWIVLQVAPELISQSQPLGTADLTPYPDPDYSTKNAALEKALAYADCHRIGVVLSLRDYGKYRATAPSYERIKAACQQHGCVRGLLLNELGCDHFTDIDGEHLHRFAGIARERGKKVFWAAFMQQKLEL